MRTIPTPRAPAATADGLPTPPRLAYLVSMYPAISHTFILREIQRLRALGHTIATASINRPDRSRDAMQPDERADADATYYVKAHGMRGALTALTWWLLRSPSRLVATLREGMALGASRFAGLAYAIEAAMVARWMHAQNTAHLHVHFGNAGAAVGVLVKRLTGCHLSYTIHGPDEFDDVRGQRLARKLEAADEVVCISQFARGQLMRIGRPDDWSKLRVCRLGVDPTQFAFRLRDGDAIARLLCVGRLTPAKGQVLLVQACAQLRDAGVDFRLTMVGDGPDRARVEQAIAALGLGERIAMTGALNQAAVRAEFDRADIFVLPSLAEGIPVVLMEAMASGVPCVTTPVNGIPELIQHERTGLLAVPGDVDDLARQLARLIADRPLRARLAEAGNAKVRADFDLDRNVAALGRIFAAFPDGPAASAAAPAHA